MVARSLRHRAPALWLLLPFSIGILVGHFSIFPVSPGVRAAAAGISLAAAFVCSRGRGWWAGLYALSLILAGSAYYDCRRAQLSGWESRPPREITCSFEIVRVFNPSKESHIHGVLARISSAPRLAPELKDQLVYIAFLRKFLPRAPARSEVLRVKGVLEALPRRAEWGSFEGFLANCGANFKLTRAFVREEVSPPSGYRRFCTRMQAFFGRTLAHGLEEHPAIASVFRGMLLGQAIELSEEQELRFTQSGTMHLFSISGLHIAAIAIAVHMLASLLRLRGWLHGIFTVMVLWLYVDITGTAPSAVRAFVMVALIEAAFALRQPVNPLSTLALAAVVALAIDPMQLFGPSFQMSYGIVAGLLLLGLPLAELWQEKTRPFRHLPRAVWTKRHRCVYWIHGALASSLGIGVATSLVSTLAGLIYFNLVTPGALVANLVLIPLSTLALWSGFLSLLFGLLHLPVVSLVFNHAAAVCLHVMDLGILGLLKAPGAYFDAQFRSPAWGFAAFSGLLVCMLAGYAAQWRFRFAYWMPFLWTATALLSGVVWSSGEAGASTPSAAKAPLETARGSSNNSHHEKRV